jgi:hypothetical protein
MYKVYFGMKWDPYVIKRTYHAREKDREFFLILIDNLQLSLW